MVSFRARWLVSEGSPLAQLCPSCPLISPLLQWCRLLEEQIAQHEKRKQAQIIGIVQPNEMALNMSLFKEAGFLSQDVKADPKPFKHKH